MKQIQIIGDSIMKGVVYDAQRDKYSLCHDRLEVAGAQIRNLSKMGATIETGMERAIRHLPEYGPETMVILEFGGNDCNHRWDEVSAAPDQEHICFVPPERFVADYRSTVQALQQTGTEVVISTLPPISAPKFMAWLSRGLNYDNILHWLGDVEILSRRQKEYSDLAKQVAIETGCRILPLREAAEQLPNWRQLICCDGMHPTEEGYSSLHSFMSSWLQSA